MLAGVVTLLGFIAVYGKITYEGHLVLRIIPQSENEVESVLQAQRIAEEKGYDIWHHSVGVGTPLDIRLSPEEYQEAHQGFSDLDLNHEIIINDVEAAGSSSSCGEWFDYGCYHRLEEINTWMAETAHTYSSMAEVITVSSSYEGRDIKGLKISGPGSGSSNPAIWLQGGIHAREWISPATLIYMTNALLKDYSDGRRNVVRIVDGFDWYIVPVLNADGYEYTWSDDRMWRKTRSIHPTSDCVGVDPNRNWDHQWGESEGSSGAACSETYRGPKACSEPCIHGATEYLLNLSKNVTVRGFIDMHSYSQMWMTPWGYTKDVPETDFNIQDASSVAAVDAISNAGGPIYDHGTIANTIYISNGNSVDWAYGKLGVLYSAAVELPDKGQYGFLLPQDQIVRVGTETFQGLVAWATYVLEH
ncbi:carboxypeptidase B-like [Haliotis cracherodii]|uniref:carboxypeptidase B-like n=1 Tax=Haliotis cracherodii TaxID=6455 RepID=UPI0039E9AE90